MSCSHHGSSVAIRSRQTAPPHTTTLIDTVVSAADCEDLPKKQAFSVPGLKKGVANCKKAAKSKTRLCSFSEVQDACPVTCGTCYSRIACTDSNARFVLRSGAKNAKSCKWVARKKTSKRCELGTSSMMCPVTCDVCAPDSKPFTFESGLGYTNTLGPNDVSPGFYGRYIGGGFVVGTSRMIGGWISPGMENVQLNANSRMKVTFDYKLTGLDQNPCPADEELFIRLRLVTGPYDWHGNVATTDLIGPFTSELSSFSTVFDINDDIVSEAKEGYTYYVDTVIAGDESDPICTGTYYASGFTLSNNFAYYEWEKPTPTPATRAPTVSPKPSIVPRKPFIFTTPAVSGPYWGKTSNDGIYGKYIDGAYVVSILRMDPGQLSPPMVEVILNEFSTLDLAFTYQRTILGSSPDPCPDTDLYLRLRLVTGSYDWYGSVATTELVGPFSTSEQTYAKTFTIADDIVSKAQDGYTYYVDTVISGPEGQSICTGTYAGSKFDVVTNFAMMTYDE